MHSRPQWRMGKGNIAITNLNYANAIPTVEWCLKDLGFEPIQISIWRPAGQSYESKTSTGLVTFNTYAEAEACFSALNTC